MEAETTSPEGIKATEAAQEVNVRRPHGHLTHQPTWPDRRFDCLVDGALWCPWSGACCGNDPTSYPFYAVFWEQVLRLETCWTRPSERVFFRLPPDTIAVTGHSFRASWNGAGRDLECALSVAI